DTGIGIAADKLATIFAPFEQADVSTTRQFGGTGLGLTITARLVTAMEGRIWVDSELGQGSTFNFTATFPIGSAPSDVELLEPPDLSQVPVLVVDDNPLNRRVLREMLESWGMPVTTVEGGKQALDAMHEIVAERGLPPLVVSDVNMPEMDGFELVRTLRTMSRLRETAIIMLTSGGRQGDIARCQELGIRSHMMKPVKQSELLEAIMFAVGGPGHVVEEPDSGEFQNTLPSLDILLAEDGRANQRLARALLEKWGHQVTIAENGQIAFELWQERPFDIILMDVQMPVMDGFEATSAIREVESKRGTRTPIIAMTARAMKGDREKCLDAGMDDYVSKPVRKQELYRALAPFSETLINEKSPMERSHPGKSESSTGNGIINWPAALETVGGDQDLLNEITMDCLTEIPELLRQLHNALQDSNFREVQRCAHTIKGTARTYHIDTLLETAGTVEESAAGSDLESVRNGLPEMERVIRDVLEAMKHSLNRGA
ncbi:MAG: response regulator, partial [Planctomycetaceae bacterium]|nr:response regulator [Planctomycetaceae bacterium]